MIDMGRQWSDRLKIWSEQFDKVFCRKTQSLDVEFFPTMEQMPLAQAEKGPFRPAPVGMKWGKKWEYGWFRTRFTLPEALAGKPLVLVLGTGPEMLVFVNGEVAGSIDKQHHYLPLTREAKPGATYSIYAECYAGHGLRNEGAGPVGYGETAVPEPPDAQVTLTDSYIGVWNEAVFQAAMDYRTLYSLLKKLPDRSLRAMKVLEGLKKFTLTADFELPEPGLTQSVVEADKVLKPLLSCTNGSTAPEFTVFGQSHLDLAWLWPVAETMRKTARTYSNQLNLMEEYPEYRFLLCEPPILEYLKSLYPDLYSRVKEGVREGKFYPDGAVWVESDTNIPSGESLIRQTVWGKRWYRRELGTDSRMAWMPDTFGFSASLPQILKKCQVPYFATQKLLRQDPEADPFPYNLFWWEGLDGSRVLSHIFKKNNAIFRPEDLITRWEEDRIQQEGVDAMLFPYGYGDGGGGPTRDMVETVRRCLDLEGAPRCRLESPSAFFDRQEAVENVYSGELYLAWHRGTLTAQARTKRGIRKAEVALKLAEYHQSRALLMGTRPKMEAINDLWKTLLFQQFHDIAAGASIHRVHQEAEAALNGVAAGAQALQTEIIGTPKDTKMVYNHLGWERTYRGCTIPAQGCRLVGPDAGWSKKAAVSADKDGYVLENRHLTCRINAAGEVVSLRKTGESREFLSAPGNRLRMYKDVNTCYDAWEIGSMYESLPVPLEGAADIRITGDEDGAAVIVTKTLHDSRLTQKIFLGHDAKRLDFVTELDWHERHKLLKVAFPVAVYTREALEEIQFGFLRRPTHRSRQHDRDQYEVCNHRYTAVCDGAVGAAVLNDCKYGVSVADSEICLTLLRAPLMPDDQADQGLHRFTYAVYPFTGNFAQSGTVRQAAELNEPLQFGSPDASEIREPIFLPEAENIVVDTIKPADTVPGAVLVRLYEAAGQETVTGIRVSEQVKQVVQTDMLEENPVALELPLSLRFTPFEIKTILLRL